MEQPRSFIPALEGVRALAALGVLTSHVAFQTGAGWQWLWGRLDLWVAVFFAVSGFLLWRRQSLAARQESTGAPSLGSAARFTANAAVHSAVDPAARPAVGRYYRARFVRIMPAYWLVVVTVLLLFPGGQRLSWEGVLANLTLTQVYVPLSLTDGLTQMWSLSVEGGFYLLLPLAAWALWGLRGQRVRWRIPTIAAVSLLFLGWAWVPLGQLWEPLGELNGQMQFPAFIPWFGVGMLLAEVWADRCLGLRQHREVTVLVQVGWLNPLVVAVLFVVAAQPFMGPVAFVQPSPGAFAWRMVLGVGIAFFSVAPLVVGPARACHPVLCSGVVQALGRWSYGIFLWHLVALRAAFQILGLPLFSGHTLGVWVVTVLLTVPLSAASYALVEEPLRRRLRAWEGRRAAAALEVEVAAALEPHVEKPAGEEV